MTIARSIVVVAVVASLAPRVHAQKAAAQAQFDEGKKLAKHGDFAEACKRFEASEKLDVGAGTELNLGDCNAKLRKTATAWAWFVQAAGTAKRLHEPKRAAEAKQRADALEAKLVRLEIDVPDDHIVPGLAITRNGQAVDKVVWNQNNPVDPDAYEIVASAAGYAAWTTVIDVTDKSQRVIVPLLVKDPNAPEVVAAAPATAPVTPPAPPEPRTETHWRKGPLALAVVGVVGLGTGIVVGALSSSDENTAMSRCNVGFDFNPTACTDPTGLSANSRARSEAIVADVGFGVGAAALAGAVIWWFTAGATERITIVPTSNGVAAAGRF